MELSATIDPHARGIGGFIHVSLRPLTLANTSSATLNFSVMEGTQSNGQIFRRGVWPLDDGMGQCTEQRWNIDLIAYAHSA